jgi:WD40 repeat protein
MVRIYEAPDIMNLSQWSVQHEITCKMACSCLTWNPSPFHPPLLAVGSDDNTNTSPKVIIFESCDNMRRWHKVESITGVVDAVHDIAFAPNVGRSYHLLGIATKDVRILSVKAVQSPQDANTTLNGSAMSTTQQTQALTLPKYEVKQVAHFEEHGAQVWRVAWNITGTILASSGDDGSVRLWKSNYLDSWKNVAVIKGDGQAGSTLAAAASAAHGISDTDRISLDAMAANSNQARYFKGGQQSAVPWH